MMTVKTPEPVGSAAFGFDLNIDGSVVAYVPAKGLGDIEATVVAASMLAQAGITAVMNGEASRVLRTDANGGTHVAYAVSGQTVGFPLCVIGGDYY